jgi:hypothetical protein
MRKIMTGFAWTLGLVASIVAVVTAREAIWGWLYPAPLIAMLAAALGGTWAYMWFGQNRPSAGDQQRLDRLLSTLPREAIKRLESEDFIAPWRERTVYPFTYFVNELNGPEEHFNAKSLEQRRTRLYSAVDAFLWAEAKKGFMHPHAKGRRNVGWMLGELEGDDQKLALAETRAAEIRAAAADVIAAHDNLVRAGRRRGYNLATLSSEAPVASWEEETEDVVRGA